MRKQRGISLVEIMVSLLAGLILTAGVIQIYAANKQTYRVADASARMQENARFAMEQLGRDLRMAGFQGCAGSVRTIVDTLNDTSSFLYNFGVAIQGFEATGASVWTPAVDSSITSPLGGMDIVAVRGVFEDGVAITGQPDNAADCPGASETADLKIGNTTGINVDDTVIAGNCTRASIFQITGVSGGTLANPPITISHILTPQPPPLPAPPGNGTADLGACYAGNGRLFHITTRVFYIRNNTAGIPALYRKDGAGSAEELVEGVEDMQILYGVDTDGDGSVNQYLRANDVSNWGLVTGIRISLLLQSVENNITTAPQPYFFNGTTVTPADRRLRRAFTTTIAVRNQLP